MTILFLKMVSKEGIKDARTRSFKNTLLRTNPLSAVPSAVLKMTLSLYLRQMQRRVGGGGGVLSCFITVQIPRFRVTSTQSTPYNRNENVQNYSGRYVEYFGSRRVDSML